MESTHDDDTDTSDSTLDPERPDSPDTSEAHGSVNDIPDESDFPEFFPKYTNDDMRDEHIGIDQEWHAAVLSEWLAWGHTQDESEDWKFWAARLHTNKTTTKLCNHVLGRAGTGSQRPITWSNIAAVLANPRWTKASILAGSGLDWAKRAQLTFPQADIFQGHPNDDGPTILDVTLSTEKRARGQNQQGPSSDGQSSDAESDDERDHEFTEDKESIKELKRENKRLLTEVRELTKENNEFRARRENNRVLKASFNKRLSRLWARDSKLEKQLVKIWKSSREKSAIIKSLAAQLTEEGDTGVDDGQIGEN